MHVGGALHLVTNTPLIILTRIQRLGIDLTGADIICQIRNEIEDEYAHSITHQSVMRGSERKMTGNILSRLIQLILALGLP